MSTEYKLNKSELTRLNRQEKLYLLYLPVLKLKQEQLQMEQNRINRAIDQVSRRHEEDRGALLPFLPCFSDSHGLMIDELVRVDEIKTQPKSIAGVFIDEFMSLSFKRIDLPYFQTPPWIIRAYPLLKQYLLSRVKLSYLKEEERVIRRELRKAMQKVNLFEQVLIPKVKEAIKRIKIALGDEQVVSVSRGKMAKLKKVQDRTKAVTHGIDQGC